MKVGLDKSFEKDVKKLMAHFDKIDKDAVKHATEIIKVITDKLHQEAQDRAPVDDGILAGDMRTKVYKASSIYEIYGAVFIPSNAASSDYALYTHEMEYNLGPQSQDKQAVSSVVVGRKWLERALTENSKAFNMYIYKKLKEFIDNVK